jgi:hypothetical protein
VDESEVVDCLEGSDGCNDRDFLRRKNSLKRDFTINR